MVFFNGMCMINYHISIKLKMNLLSVFKDASVVITYLVDLYSPMGGLGYESEEAYL